MITTRARARWNWSVVIATTLLVGPATFAQQPVQAPPRQVPAPQAVPAPVPVAKPAQPTPNPATGTVAPPQESAGSVGSAWKADVRGGANQAGVTLDPAQLDALKKVDAYFNELNAMQGRFQQTTSDKKQSRGKFFVKKPGLFRFDYAPPSKLVILSDGKMLVIEDHELRQVDRYPLDSTAFRILLRKDVNIVRDARIMDLQAADDILILSIVDKDGDSSGAIKLFFVQKPTFELKEWIITDAQGIETRIEVSDLDKAQPIDSKRFVATSFDPAPTTGQ